MIDRRRSGHTTVIRGAACCALTVLVLLLPLLAACGADPSIPRTPAPGSTLPPVSADGRRLMAGGQPFEVRGFNYVRTTGADPNTCWTFQFGADPRCPWDMQPINADLDRLQQLGVNTVRVFLNYYVFGGQRKVDENYDKSSALAHLDDFIAAANARGMYVLPVLLIEYPQDLFGPEHYERALELHVRPLVRHLAGKPGLLGLDLFNEPDIGSPVDLRCWDWDNADEPRCFPLAEERQRFLQVVHDEVKRLDPQRLTTIGMAFAKSYFEPAEAALRMADLVDFYTFHYYDNEPYHSGRYAAHWYYGQGFPADLTRSINELQALGLNKPTVVTELGFPTEADSTRTLPDLHRDLALALRTVRETGATGMVVWSFQTTPEDALQGVFPRSIP